MCGINCYIGYRYAYEILFKGLVYLQYRGEDSCGILTVNTSDYTLIKYVTDTIKAINKFDMDMKINDYIGLGHTRKASVGSISLSNAHPQSDMSNRYFVVHQGELDNYESLRRHLEDNGIIFKSETDTEIIPQMIYYNVTILKLSFIDAVKSALNQIQGKWAIALFDVKEPDKLLLTRRICPIFLNILADEIYASSNIDNLPIPKGKIMELPNDTFLLIERDTISKFPTMKYV